MFSAGYFFASSMSSSSHATKSEPAMSAPRLLSLPGADDGDGCQHAEADIHHEDPRSNVENGKAAVSRDLVKVRTVRLPDTFAAGEAADQSD